MWSLDPQIQALLAIQPSDVNSTLSCGRRRSASAASAMLVKQVMEQP
jgi:hypothetical protein